MAPSRGLYDFRSGKVTSCGENYPGLLGEMRWNNDGRGLLVHKFENTRTGFAQLDPRTREIKHVADAFYVGLYGFSASADGKTIAYVGSAFRQPPEVWVMSGKTQKAVTKTNPQTESWQLGDVREMSWTATTDGKTIYGVLVTPPGYVQGTPVKTVVQIHGGPEWAWWSGWLGSWHEWAQMLASHGYAVFMPNPRGSDGQGTAFAKAAKGDWGGGDYQDVIDGVDAGQATHCRSIAPRHWRLELRWLHVRMGGHSYRPLQGRGGRRGACRCGGDGFDDRYARLHHRLLRRSVRQSRAARRPFDPSASWTRSRAPS